MLKKIIILFTLPTALFIYLESCNKPCDHRETREIIGIELTSESDDDFNRTVLRMELEYQSYFVNNFQFNLTNKSFAAKQIYDPCFNEFLTPIDSISLISKNDFSPTYLANRELNSLFKVNYSGQTTLDKFNYDIFGLDDDNIYFDEFITSFSFLNELRPTLDSIHDLYITVYCSGGITFSDSLIGTNLKSNL